MRLLDAFRLGSNQTLALSGAGGKSAAMFRLGRELSAQKSSPPGPVLLSATTHLSQDQAQLADQHLIIEREGDIPSIHELQRGQVFLFSGPPVEDNRLAGLSFSLMECLRVFAVKLDTAFLIEADGSRQLPLKAPGEHEPLIPDWVDLVVVVAGLSGLGMPLDPGWVHRPERFGALCELGVGDIIREDHLIRLLTHPKGGLKGIPENARRVVMLNQANSPALQAAALRLSERLLPIYQAVVVADLPPAHPNPPASAESDADPGAQVSALHERIAAVVLAAGAATRFGSLKQILPYQGKPLVRRAVETARAAGLSPLIVVLGHAAEAVRSTIQDLPVTIVENSNWESGQASSVAVGIDGLPDDVGGAVFMMADQPLLPVNLLRSLVELHASQLAPVVVPLAGGQRANPVLFDRRLFPELRKLTGDTGGRVLFSKYPPVWLPWNDPDSLRDIDTLQDYENLLHSQAAEPQD